MAESRRWLKNHQCQYLPPNYHTRALQCPWEVQCACCADVRIFLVSGCSFFGGLNWYEIDMKLFIQFLQYLHYIWLSIHVYYVKYLFIYLFLNPMLIYNFAECTANQKSFCLTIFWKYKKKEKRFHTPEGVLLCPYSEIQVICGIL